MTDWEKLKVTELKEELKSRNVPLTGLKLKQHFIDKLVELESAEDVEPEPEPDSSIQTDGFQSDQKAEEQDRESVNGDNSTAVKHPLQASTEGKAIAYEMPALLKNEESQATETATPPSVRAEDADDAEEMRADNPFIPEATVLPSAKPETDDKEEVGAETSNDEELFRATDSKTEDRHTLDPSGSEHGPIPQLVTGADVEMISDAVEPTGHHVSALDDQKKRKRRSASPSVSEEEIMQKKAKADDGTPIARRESNALDKIKEATYAAELSRQPNDTIVEEPLRPMEASSDPHKTRIAKEVGSLPDAYELQNRPFNKQRSLSVENNDRHSKDLSQEALPARHSATSSIYIRNFKRPLHIPTLRSHITLVAKALDDSPAEDSITQFYLDSIRTHAFVSFTSVSAASRVRDAMHGTRFPDEAMREPLWIDYIPTEKVKAWIDEESSGHSKGSGGPRGNRKYEVVYNTHDDGRVEAQLQEVSNAGSLPPSYPDRTNRKPSDVATTSNSITGVHPDRASLVPREPQARASQITKKSDAGAGFTALDELFSSTVAKPKLYFKLPNQSIINDRLDMIRELRVGHTEMGRSGDQGMKRYTFEDYRGREEWVDKGPEFGFGRKGQDRLAGVRGRGGFRGGRRGGDSWRGR